MSSISTQSNGEIVRKYQPWPMAHIDHWFAARQMTKHDYLIVLHSRGFSEEQAIHRAAAIRNKPEDYLIPGGD